MLKMFSLKTKKALKQKGGFTLLELVVVVAIIAILALGVGVTAIRQIDKARVSRLVADVDTAKTAMAMYNVEVRDYPATLAELTQPANGGPYMNRVLATHGFGDYSYDSTSGEPILTVEFSERISAEMKQRVFEALGGEGTFEGDAIEINLYSGEIVTEEIID